MFNHIYFMINKDNKVRKSLILINTKIVQSLKIYHVVMFCAIIYIV
jgi:hypothetical protein